MDFKLPDICGDEATRQILGAKPSVRVLGISAFRDPFILKKMVCAGAAGFIFKPEEITELLPAIRSVAAGATFFCLEDLRLTFSFGDAEYDVQDKARKIERLTVREREIFDLKVTGWRNFSISKRLGISESTVSGHVSSIFRKLECQDITDLVRFAMSTRPDD